MSQRSILDLRQPRSEPKDDVWSGWLPQVVDLTGTRPFISARSTLSTRSTTGRPPSLHPSPAGPPWKRRPPPARFHVAAWRQPAAALGPNFKGSRPTWQPKARGRAACPPVSCAIAEEKRERIIAASSYSARRFVLFSNATESSKENAKMRGSTDGTEEPQHPPIHRPTSDHTLGVHGRQLPARRAGTLCPKRAEKRGRGGKTLPAP